MSKVRGDVGGLIAGIVAEVLEEAEVGRGVQVSSTTFKKAMLVKSGVEFSIFIAMQNYLGAVFVVANQLAGTVVSSKAADVILAKGGFAARLELERTQKEAHGRLLASAFEPHTSVSIWRLYQEELFWGAERAELMGQMAMALTDVSRTAAVNATRFGATVKPRPYHRMGLFRRDAVYRGTWSSEAREGWGTLNFPGFGVYSGSWAADEPKGFGHILYEDGRAFAGSVEPGTGERIIGVSRLADGTTYAGEHRFPLYPFPNYADERDTVIVPDGYGVRISDEGVTRATWRRGAIEKKLETRAEFYSQLNEKLYEQYRHTSPELAVEAAEWALKSEINNSAWRALHEHFRSENSALVFDETF